MYFNTVKHSNLWSWDSSAHKKAGNRLNSLGSIPSSYGIFLFTTISRLSLGSTQAVFLWG